MEVSLLTIDFNRTTHALLASHMCEGCTIKVYGFDKKGPVMIQCNLYCELPLKLAFPINYIWLNQRMMSKHVG